jgi:hypothetical protein
MFALNLIAVRFRRRLGQNLLTNPASTVEAVAEASHADQIAGLG